MEKLKAEIFDIIYQQDTLKIEYAKLEQLKQKKLKELEECQNSKSDTEASS